MERSVSADMFSFFVCYGPSPCFVVGGCVLEVVEGLRRELDVGKRRFEGRNSWSSLLLTLWRQNK